MKLVVMVAGRYSAPTAEERAANLRTMNDAAVAVALSGAFTRSICTFPVQSLGPDSPALAPTYYRRPDFPLTGKRRVQLRHKTLI